MAKLTILMRRLLTVTATVVLAAAVGLVGDLAYFPRPPNWWPIDGSADSTWWSKTSFFVAALIMASIAAWTLVRLHRGVPDFQSFDASTVAPRADLIVMPLPDPGRDPVDVDQLGPTWADVTAELAADNGGGPSNLQPAWEVLSAVLGRYPSGVDRPSDAALQVLLFRSRQREGGAADDHPMESLMRKFGITHSTHDLHNVFDPKGCFDDMAGVLRGHRHRTIVFAPGGTAPMQQACAMLSIARGQFLAYKPRDQDVVYYDARVRIPSPVARLLDF